MRLPPVGAVLGIVFASIWILAAALGPVVAPYSPNQQHLVDRLMPPAWMDGGQTQYLLGTDQLGRDIFSRLLYGARPAMLVGVAVVSTSAVIGTALGLATGYFRGWLDVVVMAAVDVFLAFPFLLLALVILAMLGSSVTNVILVLAAAGWMPYARVVRADTLSIQQREFIEAARAAGVGDSGIILRGILPNLMGPVIVIATLQIATVVLAEATLTFLGLGIPTSVPTWGQMLESGRGYLFGAWWLSTFPGVCLFIVVLGVNLLGDWWRDRLDPRLR